MPKLLAYLPCEKVVIEDESKNAIFALWQKDKAESGEFESKSALVSPSGEVLLETPVAKLSFGANTRQQVVNRMADFPVWTPWPA